ncbi:MAG: DMT family transporter [Theionarchaea archaeon]|nr:DMT family transporter [Theionarchaea archaeon]MBU7036913.1 DMT family transporter [Theionarchaea archaeon]
MSHVKHSISLAIAGCLLGTISTFSAVLRDNGISSFQQSFSRTFLALLVILVVFCIKKIDFSIPRKEFPYYVVLGMIMAAVGFFENSAVALGTPVAVVVLFLYTQPAWTALLGKILFKEQLTWARRTAVATAFFGIFLISEVWSISRFNVAGGGIALAAGVLLSVEFIMIKSLSLKSRHFLVSMFWFYTFRSIFTVGFGLLSRMITSAQLITGFSFFVSLETAILLVLFALVPMVVGMGILYKSIKYVPIVHAGVIMMMEAISGVIYGYLILGEPINEFTIAGGVLILLASVLTILEKRGE